MKNLRPAIRTEESLLYHPTQHPAMRFPVTGEFRRGLLAHALSPATRKGCVSAATRAGLSPSPARCAFRGADHLSSSTSFVVIWYIIEFFCQEHRGGKEWHFAVVLLWVNEWNSPLYIFWRNRDAARIPWPSSCKQDIFLPHDAVLWTLC